MRNLVVRKLRGSGSPTTTAFSTSQQCDVHRDLLPSLGMSVRRLFNCHLLRNQQAFSKKTCTNPIIKNGALVLVAPQDRGSGKDGAGSASMSHSSTRTSSAEGGEGIHMTRFLKYAFRGFQIELFWQPSFSVKMTVITSHYWQRL